MHGRNFWIWFVIGTTAAALNTSFVVLGEIQFLSYALGALTAPGVILALPIMNLVGSPWWAVGWICVLNGTVYGFAAWLMRRMLQKRLSSGR